MAQYTCPHCQNPFTTAAGNAPKRVRCPHCRHVVEIPAAAARWYIGRAKRKYGPYGWQQLVDLARRGELGRDDYVLREGESQWRRADTVPDLFADSAPSTDDVSRIAKPASQANTGWSRALLWLMAGLAGVAACVLFGAVAVVAHLYFRAPSEPQPNPPVIAQQKKDDILQPPPKKNELAQKDEKQPPIDKTETPAKPVKQEQPRDQWAEPFVTRLNEHRVAAGLGPVALDAELSRGCAAHAQYLARHVDPAKAAPSDVYDEDAGKDGFSAAGQLAARNAIVAFTEPLVALERWMGRLIGRVTLLGPDMQSVGVGFARDGGKWFCVVDTARGRGEPIVVYPAPKQRDVPLAFSGGPELKVPNAAAGFPLTVAFPPGKLVTDARIELRDADGKPIDAWTWTPDRPLRPGAKKNTLALIARSLLQSNATYQVNASAQLDGKPWLLTWSFTTEDDGDRDGVWAKKALDAVNAYRKQAGLKAVALDASLGKACQAHARYLVLNEGNPALRGLSAHGEDPKLPGYSKEGEEAGKASNIAIGDFEPTDGLHAWMATLYHRTPILEPNLRTIGFGCARGRRQGWATVLNIASGRDKSPRPHAVIYPVADQDGVPLHFPIGGEEPNPIPDDADGRVGFPITVVFPPGQTPTAATGKLTDAKGNEVPAWFSSPEKPANPSFSRFQGNALCLIAKDPLKPGTTYVVHFKGMRDEAAWEQRWKFTTADAGLDAMAATRAAIERINRFRALAGLAAVTLDEKLSRGCQLHAEYLGKNADALRKRKGASVNDEDPQLPWYHADGRRAAMQSLVFSNAPTPLLQIDDLMATALSRTFILDPNLQRVGYGCYNDVGRGWRCVLDPNGGRGAARIVVYPAANQVAVPAIGYERLPDAKGDSGFPITVTFPPSAVLRNADAVLKDADGKDVPIHVSSPEKPLAAKLQRGTVAVHPLAPLRVDASYQVTVSVIVDGAEWRQTWRFTTK